jgi:tRNA threonylcarbamoyladenosine modification (KEOPS) complex Cgi121 subunit
MTRSGQNDEMALVVYERVLEKLQGGTDVARALKQEIALRISGEKRWVA